MNYLLDLYSKYAGILFVGGALMLAHAHNRKKYIDRLLRRGRKTEGKVIEVRRDPGSLFSKTEGDGFAPVVEYTTHFGNVSRHYSTTFRDPSRYDVGQTVTVWYESYKSRREAALEDDEPGDLPRKLAIAGGTLLLLSLPAIARGVGRLM